MCWFYDMGEEPEYSFVAPFVLGDLDEHAFCCGTRYGEISYRIQVEKPDTLEHYVEPDIVAQLDLLAMNFGYAMKATPWDEYPDEWVLVEFSKTVSS